MKRYATHCTNTSCRHHNESESGCKRYSTHTVDLCAIFEINDLEIPCEVCGECVPFNDTIPSFGKRRCPACSKKLAAAVRR